MGSEMCIRDSRQAIEVLAGEVGVNIGRADLGDREAGNLGESAQDRRMQTAVNADRRDQAGRSGRGPSACGTRHHRDDGRERRGPYPRGVRHNWQHPMWGLEDSWRYGAGCLVLLGLLAGCDAGSTDSAAPSTSSATTTSVADTATATVPPTAQGPRTQKWIALQVGECLADPPPTDPSVVDVSVVDCAIPHAAEVYLRVDVEVNAAIADVADQRCGAGLTQYTGQATAGPLSTTYLIDSNQDRTSDNPMPSTVICLLQAANGGPLTGSARR